MKGNFSNDRFGLKYGYDMKTMYFTFLVDNSTTIGLYVMYIQNKR